MSLGRGANVYHLVIRSPRPCVSGLVLFPTRVEPAARSIVIIIWLSRARMARSHRWRRAHSHLTRLAPTGRVAAPG